MKKICLLLILLVISLASCKTEEITSARVEDVFKGRLAGRWKYTSKRSRITYANGTVTDNGTVSRHPASNITFNTDGTVRIIDFGVSDENGTYQVVSGNEFYLALPEGRSYCQTEDFASERFTFTARINRADGSTVFTTYFLADRTSP